MNFQHVAWDPWNDFDRLHNEVSRLFIRGGQEAQNDDVPMNFWISDDGAVVTALLPGVDPQSLDISVLGKTLTLRGERSRFTSSAAESVCSRQERPQGAFERIERLPFAVDDAGIEAHYAHGILQIKLPMAAADKPKRIAVNAA